MSELPPRGAPIFAMGNPLDLGLTIAVGTNGGILDQTDDSRILFSGSLNPGMSGRTDLQRRTARSSASTWPPRATTSVSSCPRASCRT